MSNWIRSQGDVKRRAWQKKTLMLMTALIVLFAISGAGAQERESVSLTSGGIISLNVTQMDLQDVLRLIAEKANLNIIISKEVSGSVTVRLKDVNLWQALAAILESNGFTYREEKGIIRVVKLGEAVEEEKEALVTEVVFLKYASVDAMKKACQHLLSRSGTMEVDSRSNALIITDLPQNIDKIRELVSKLDRAGIPMFDLKGILSAPDHSLAMINDQILKVGDMIGEFTVDEIGEDTVILRRENETITLRLREELRAPEK